MQTTQHLLLELVDHLEISVMAGLLLQKIHFLSTPHHKVGLMQKQLLAQQGQQAHAVQLDLRDLKVLVELVVLQV
jgi:hypothetical protein